MKRLLITFIVTIVLGVGLYFLVTIFTDKNEEEIPVNKEETIEKEEFDISNWTAISIEDLLEVLQNNEEVIIFVGNKDDENTKKVSTTLGNTENIDSLNIYYLEKGENINENTSYQTLLTTYPTLSNYMNFTPVILVFRENTLIGGLPGGVEEKSLVQFFEYTEVFQ